MTRPPGPSEVKRRSDVPSVEDRPDPDQPSTLGQLSGACPHSSNHAKCGAPQSGPIGGAHVTGIGALAGRSNCQWRRTVGQFIPHSSEALILHPGQARSLQVASPVSLAEERRSFPIQDDTKLLGVHEPVALRHMERRRATTKL